MRKSRLLKLLETFDDEDHIHIWNGFVDDYMPIEEIVDTKVYKEDVEMRIKLMKHEEPNVDVFKAMSENPPDYSLSLPYKITKVKRVGIILAGMRGKKSVNRGGCIDY